MNSNSIIVNELMNALETNGEISITNGFRDIFIQEVDNKEGYSYVSSTNKEFKDTREAVDWAIERMNEGEYEVHK